MLVRVLLCVLAVSVMGVRQNCVPVRNPLSNEYICTRVQKWINEISAIGDKATCSQMVNNDLIEAFSTVTEADDCSLNWPTPDYEQDYVTAYQNKIYNAYQKYKPSELRKLAGSALESGSKDTQSLQARLFKLLMQRSTDTVEDDPTPADSLLNTQVKYVRMTAEEYLRRIKANLGDDCEVPRWPCCSELLRKLEEEALAKQLAEQAQAAAAAAAAASGTATGAATTTDTTTTTTADTTTAPAATTVEVSSTGTVV